MKTTRIVMLICALFMLLGTTGCWDRKEVNDIAFVTGSAIDIEPQEEGPPLYRVSVQFPLPGQLSGVKGGGGGNSGTRLTYVDSAVSRSLRDAQEKLQSSVSRQLYLGHRRIIMISEAMARNGIDNLLDIAARMPQNRLTSFIVVTRGSAKDFLLANAPVERSPSEWVRELAVESMQQPRSVKHVIDSMLTTGIDPAVPLIALREPLHRGNNGDKSKAIRLEGLAVFRDNKLSGILKDHEAKGALWAMNQIKQPLLTVEAPDQSGIISVSFPELSVSVTALLEEAQPKFLLTIRTRGSVLENESSFVLSVPGNLSELEKKVAKQLEEQVRQGVAALQKAGSDPIGLGDAVYRKNPPYWHRIRESWEDIYPKVSVEVRPLIHIEHTGSIFKPIVEEDERFVE